MTKEELRLSDEKMRAEIAKMSAEIIKLGADTAKINRENVYYPVIVTATATLAIVALVKVFL